MTNDAMWGERAGESRRKVGVRTERHVSDKEGALVGPSSRRDRRCARRCASARARRRFQRSKIDGSTWRARASSSARRLDFSRCLAFGPSPDRPHSDARRDDPSRIRLPRRRVFDSFAPSPNLPRFHAPLRRRLRVLGHAPVPDRHPRRALGRRREARLARLRRDSLPLLRRRGRLQDRRPPRYLRRVPVRRPSLRRRRPRALPPLRGQIRGSWSPDKPCVLVTGGVHGYETSGVQGALRFLATRAAEYAETFNLCVAPCVSPWGYERIQRWNSARRRSQPILR